MISDKLVETSLATGNTTKCLEVLDGLPPNIKMSSAYVQDGILHLFFDDGQPDVTEKDIIVEAKDCHE